MDDTQKSLDPTASERHTLRTASLVPLSERDIDVLLSMLKDLLIQNSLRARELTLTLWITTDRSTEIELSTSWKRFSGALNTELSSSTP